MDIERKSQMNQQQLDTVQLNQTEDEVEINLMELLFFYRTRIILILIGFFVGALIAGLVTFYLITPKYTATSKVYMVSASSDKIVDLTDLNIGTSLSTDYEELLKVRPILEEVIEEKKLKYTYEQLLGMLSISTITDTRILTITVESTDPEEAKVIANALAYKAEKKLPTLMETSTPHIAEEAVLPKSQSSPSLSKNTLIGGLLGAVVVIGFLTFFYLTDDTLKSAEDVEKAFGIMPLTVIPEGEVEEISDKKEEEIRKQKKKSRRKRS